MDIMDIQAVESKLSDVTVTPIPRSQVQNFYNYQQQREREQQPQIQISAIHTPRDRSANNDRVSHVSGSVRDLYKRERDYHQHVTGGNNSAAVAAAALQYTQQLQAQLALLQQQANTTASPSITLTPANPRGSSSSSNHAANLSSNLSSLSSSLASNMVANSINLSTSSNGNNNNTVSQLKYPLSSSPIMLSSDISQISSNITTPMTSTANLPSLGQTGANNGLTKYAQLLAVIEEMGRDIRPTYTGSRTSVERLKRGIVHARILVRECLMETERSARQ